MDENRIVGYFVAIGEEVQGPPGKAHDVLFGNRQRAASAAEEWELVAGSYEVHELWYQGLLGMTLNDTGDVLMDGMAARKVVECCRGEGRMIHEDEIGRIDVMETRCRYSSRLLLLGISEISQMTY